MCAGGSARADGQRLRELFRKVSPSVVVVRTVEKVLAPEGLVDAPGLGSGVLVSKEGKVLTAAHVVQTSGQVAVEFMDGRLVPARVIGSVPRADVAALQLEHVPSDVAPAKLGDSDRLEVGDDLFVIGAPYGIGHTLTVGHMGGRPAVGGMVGGIRLELLQTDAASTRGTRAARSSTWTARWWESPHPLALRRIRGAELRDRFERRSPALRRRGR